MKDTREYRNALNQSGLEMLELCKQQMLKSKIAFLNHDSELAEEVLHMENRVNALDIKIDKDCERFIALHTPVASDLRFVLALRKINFDLERVGDHAYGISKYIVEMNTPIDKTLFAQLRFEEMYDVALCMLKNITDAYVNEDTTKARKTFKHDKLLNTINMEAFRIISMEVKKNPELIDQYLLLFSVIKKTERIGDLISNIAEEIIFYREAEVLKHRHDKKLP